VERGDIENGGAGVTTAVKQIISETVKHTGKLPIIPLIDGAQLSDNDKKAVSDALKSEKYENYITRN
jgi:hypothetical protein